MFYQIFGQWFFALTFLSAFSVSAQELPNTESVPPVRVAPQQIFENFAGEIHIEQDSAKEKADFTQSLKIKNTDEKPQSFKFLNDESFDVIYTPPADFSKITFILIAGSDSDVATFQKTKENLQLEGFGILRIFSQQSQLDSLTSSRQSKNIISTLDQLGVDKTKIAIAAYSSGTPVGARLAFDLYKNQNIQAPLSLINLSQGDQKTDSDFITLIRLLKNPTNLHSLLSLFVFDSLTSAEEQFSDIPMEFRGVFSKLSAELLSDPAVTSDAISNFLEGATPH